MQVEGIQAEEAEMVQKVEAKIQEVREGTQADITKVG